MQKTRSSRVIQLDANIGFLVEIEGTHCGFLEVHPGSFCSCSKCRSDGFGRNDGFLY